MEEDNDFFFSKQDGRLKVNDIVLVIDGEEVSEMATNDISTMMKEIEERSDSDSLELLVMREAPISSSSYGHRKVYSRALRTSSWSQPSSQTPEQVDFPDCQIQHNSSFHAGNKF
ncbi:MAG: hypothetical protein MJE68_30485 [Proteobacteria bacterium]|nr:hypothetical protein [Pseudomonadota bacterium]